MGTLYFMINFSVNLKLLKKKKKKVKFLPFHIRKGEGEKYNEIPKEWPYEVLARMLCNKNIHIAGKNVKRYNHLMKQFGKILQPIHSTPTHLLKKNESICPHQY